MPDWLDGVGGAGYTAALFWTFGALLIVIVLLLIVKLVRSMTFGTFVAGGRNRKTRLAVMDAAAVDSQRRLVLIRRDDVEHLLLIGGPTDVVVETDIKISQQRRAAIQEAGRETLPQPAVTVAPQQLPPSPAARQRAEAARQPVYRPPPEWPAPAARPQDTALRQSLSSREGQRAAPAPAPGQSSQRQTEQRPSPVMPPATPFNPAQRAAPAAELDDELLKELEVSLEETEEKPVRRPGTPSLDDEMTKLLGELSTPRR